VPGHPQQILDAGYFSAHSGVMPPLHFLDHGKPFEIHPHCNVMVNESNAHLAAALAGIGLVHTLDFMVRPAVERGDLAVILDAWRPKPLDVYISYAPRSHMHQAASSAPRCESSQTG
jgi:DNA-binding transcriptional LysR family regulator